MLVANQEEQKQEEKKQAQQQQQQPTAATTTNSNNNSMQLDNDEKKLDSISNGNGNENLIGSPIPVISPKIETNSNAEDENKQQTIENTNTTSDLLSPENNIALQNNEQPKEIPTEMTTEMTTEPTINTTETNTATTTQTENNSETTNTNAQQSDPMEIDSNKQ